MPSTLLFDGAGPKSPEPEKGKVYSIAQPDYPEFIFEWHPESKKVYVARLGVTPVIGEMLAMDITNFGAAQNLVLVWLRGYRTAKMEMIAPHEHIRKLLD